MAKRKKKATSSDVARLAGVSQPTVSMILNHYENSRFSKETVQKVMDACEQLDYRIPSSRRQTEEGGGRRMLIAVYPSMENLHYIRTLKAAAGQARSKGYTMISITSNRDSMIEKQVMEMAISFKVAGVLFLYKPVNIDALTRLESQMPVVLLCDKSEADTSSVGLDSEKTGVLIGEHLLSLGHRRIAYVSPVMSDIYVPRQLRLAGIQRAFRDAHIVPLNVKVCTLDSEGVSPALDNPSYYEAGYRLGGVS